MARAEADPPGAPAPLRRSAVPTGGGRLPRWLRILYTLFLCLLVPVYWRSYGPANFLWASDIALFVVLVGLWSEHPLPGSMMAIGVMPFEIVWVLDLLSGARLLGVTSYMFEPGRPLLLRGLSLFHVMLPLVVVLLLRRLGYDRRALAAQTLLTWLVLPASYLLSEPADNVNLVFGPGEEPQAVLPPLLYLALEMIAVPLLVCLPAHLAMRRLPGPRRDGAMTPVGPG